MFNANRVSAVVAAVAAALTATTALLAAPAKAQNFVSVSDYYSQDVSWTTCGTDTLCGNVTVPLDWSKPAGSTISLAVAYHKASNAKPLGSIIFNPGGPGSSGVDFVKNSLASVGTARLKQNYNFVGWDPRGVQNSKPSVQCYLKGKDTASAKMDNFLYGDTGYPMGSSRDIAATKVELKKFAKACAQNTGDLLNHLDSISTAKDLDVIRAVMGDDKLNYLGYSYGTLIGLDYANLFPAKVGRMVLDGVVDPTVSDANQSLNQLKGFDLALRDYLTDCLGSSSCPFTGTLMDAQIKIKNFLRALETKPISTTDHGRKLTVAMATSGIDMALYSKNYWQYLSQGFTSAFKGDGTTLQRLADYYNDRGSDGKYGSNETEAFITTSCADGREPADAKSMAAQNKRILAASFVMGRYWQFGGLACASFNYKAAKPLANYSAKGAPTILVVGTTGDPATPYAQAQNVAHSVLTNARLITYKGEGHTAYGQGHSCVDGAVDDFLVGGSVPSNDLTCQ